MSTTQDIPTSSKSFKSLGFPATHALWWWLDDNIGCDSDIFFRENEDGTRVDSEQVIVELDSIEENYARMLDFIETVAAGNTEIQALENEARNILDSLSRPGA